MDLSALSMMFGQLASTQTPRVYDEKNAGMGVVGSTLSQGLQGFATGGLVGGGLGLVSGLVSGLTAKKQAEEARKALEKQEKIIDQDRSASILRTYPTKGLGVSGFYKYGGNMKKNYAYGGDMGTSKEPDVRVLDGGKLKQIAQSVKVVQGDKHGQDSNNNGMGGVTVLQNGKKAEIEDGEVVYDGLVFSNYITAMPGVSMADMAKMLSKDKLFQKAEAVRVKAKEDVMAKDTITKNTGARNLLKYPDSENVLHKLFKMQESIKQQEMQAVAQAQQPQQEQPQEGQVPMGKLGIDLGKLGNQAAPYLDNIVNTLLTTQTPQIPTPRLTTAPRLQTKFDISGMQANIANSEAAVNNLITNNTNSGSVLAGRLGATRAQSLSAQNELATTKVNAENELKNQQAQAEYTNRVANTQALSGYDYAKMQRKDDIATRISANAANATEDLRTQQMDKMSAVRDRQEMFLTLNKYADTGVLDRANVLPALSALEQGKSLEEVIRLYSKNKKVQ